MWSHEHGCALFLYFVLQLCFFSSFILLSLKSVTKFLILINYFNLHYFYFFVAKFLSTKFVCI